MPPAALKEAEMEAMITGKRFSHDKVFSSLRHKLKKREAEDV